jgi:hypothetical protein
MRGSFFARIFQSCRPSSNLPLLARCIRIKAEPHSLTFYLNEEMNFAHRAGSLAKLAKLVRKSRSLSRRYHSGGNAVGRIAA